MDTTPYWIDSAPIKSFPPLGADLKVDVLVVGAGITGITAAYLLKKAGVSIALIERERVASIDTGHTTAHLTYVTDDSLETLTRLGRDHAQATWDAGACAIDEIDRIVREEKIDCEYSRVPGFLHASLFGEGGKDERADLKKEADLAQQLGFDAAFVEAVPHFGVPGVRFANQAKFHPRKYLRRLVEIIADGGAHIFEESAAEEFDAEKRRAKVNGHWISFDRVVIATNNPLMGLATVTSASLLQTKLSLYSSYVLGARIPRGSLPIALFWDTVDPYHYLRIDRHADFDYAVFGGDDHKTGQVTDTEKCYAQLVPKLKKIAPDAEIDHRWSGQVIMTNDDLPYIGQNADGQFIATGYCGNGITFGTVASMMARDWAIGAKNPWTDLFDVNRKLLKLGAWDYLIENKDYPYYMIKDRLARAEADSVRELKPGHGAIVKSGGKKVAAYRDKKGEVRKVSAICTHMGCLVHWNSAEETWDCPCHGSRFKSTGEVIAGPAEDPLAPA
ncbi:MAG TPA: FAD-dependent oxidoreductase [Chthoniobacterales bacterium]|nr:FAD-dependent oxidoreductase [Chthoniobacterales bacterium]